MDLNLFLRELAHVNTKTIGEMVLVADLPSVVDVDGIMKACVGWWNGEYFGVLGDCDGDTIRFVDGKFNDGSEKGDDNDCGNDVPNVHAFTFARWLKPIRV